MPGSRFLPKLRFFGIIQPFADAVKFLIKEDITPRAADRWVHLAAPIVVTFAALLIWAVIPFGKGMVGTDLNIGILYIVSVSSLATISLLMAGWGANNKYALLGALRGVAQMISYEVPMVLSILTVVLLAGSMSMMKIAEAQGALGGMGWYIFYLPMGLVAFVIYFICAVAELNRAPFDMPEGESEIVAGFHIEYSRPEVGPLLPGRVLQRPGRGGDHHDALPGRLAGPAAAALCLVLGQGRRGGLYSAVAAGHAAALPRRSPDEFCLALSAARFVGEHLPHGRIVVTSW